MPLNEENDYGEISISENVLKDLVYKSVEGHLKEKKIFDSKIQKELQKSIKVELEKIAEVYVSNIDITIDTLLKPEEIEEYEEEYEEVQEDENEEKEKAEEKDEEDEEEEEEKKD